MTYTPVGATPLRARVAEEVRAALARRRISAARFARELGMSQPYLQRRLSGEVAFDLDDLERIADALGRPVGELLPADVRSAGRTTVPKVGPAERPRDTRPPGGPRTGDDLVIRRQRRIDLPESDVAQLSGAGSEPRGRSDLTYGDGKIAA